MIVMRYLGLTFLLFVPLACSSTVTGTGTSSSSGGTSGSSGTSGTSGSSGTTSGGTSGTALVGSSGGTSTTGAKAIASCNKLIDAVYGIATRCGYTDTRADIEASATQGKGCIGIAAIADDVALNNTCIPYLNSIGAGVECSEFETNGLDPSCQKQLIPKAD